MYMACILFIIHVGATVESKVNRNADGRSNEGICLTLPGSQLDLCCLRRKSSDLDALTVRMVIARGVHNYHRNILSNSVWTL